MREYNLTRDDSLNLLDMQIIEESVFIDESGALTFAPMPPLDTNFLDQTFPTDQFELQPQTIFQIQKANDDSTIYFVLPEDIPFIHSDDIVDDSVIFTTPLNQRIIDNEDNPLITDGTTTFTTNVENEIINDVVNQSLRNDSNIVATGIEDQILDDESRESFINGSSMFSKLTGDDIRDLANIDIDDSSIFSKLLDDDISDVGNETMIDVVSIYDPTIEDESIGIGNEADIDVNMATLHCATIHDENMKDLENCTIITSPIVYRCNEVSSTKFKPSSITIEKHSITDQTIYEHSTNSSRTIQEKNINNYVANHPITSISTKTINGDINDISSQSVLNQPTTFVKKNRSNSIKDSNQSIVDLSNIFTSEGKSIINLSNHATMYAKTCENLTDLKKQNMIDSSATHNQTTEHQVIHDIGNRLISEPPPLALIGSPRIYQATVGDKNLGDHGRMIKIDSSTMFITTVNHNTKIDDSQDQFWSDENNVGHQAVINAPRKFVSRNRGKKMSSIDDWKIGGATKYTITEEDEITSNKDNVEEQATVDEPRRYQTNETTVKDKKITKTIDHKQVDGINSEALINVEGPTIYTVDQITSNEENIEVMVDDSTIFHTIPDQTMDDEDNRIIISDEDSISSNESIKDSSNVYTSMENQRSSGQNKIDMVDKSIIDTPTTNDQNITEHYSPDDSIESDVQSIEGETITSQQPKEIIHITSSDDPFNDENSSWSVDSLSPTSPDPHQSTSTKQHLYRCEYKKCKESFISLYEKKIHLDSHIFHESTEFRCGICNAVFDRAVDRNKHVEAHAIPPTYKCKGCKTDFTYFTVLMRHLKEKRCSSKNPFTCYFCEAKITDYEDLIKHHQLNMKQCLCGAKKCGMQVFQLHSSICARTLPESPQRFEKKRFKKGKP